jgi:molybdopterin molybdotransferase
LREDLLVTTGGVSVGKYDLVKEVLGEMGVEILFWKVNIKPGMPLLFAWHSGIPVFGLPGNPVSSMVTFLQFVKPALRRMMGFSAEPDLMLKAKLAHDFTKTDRKRHFLRGVYGRQDGEGVVRTTGSQVSNVMTSLTLANCLIIIPEEVEFIRAGEEVEVEFL